MKILLTGKNGQVGFELRRALCLLGEVNAIGLKECDLRDEAEIRRVVRNLEPDVIVNAAAYTAVDKAESEPALAEAINTRAPAVLAEEAQALDAILVHYSTDYVFDGAKDGAYKETDQPNPQSVYGATKLAGELAVQSSCARHIILRTSWVLGVHGSNFAKTMLRLAAERDMLAVVSDQYGAPTSAALLADLTSKLLHQAAHNQSSVFSYGLYHAVASGEVSWYRYACYIIEQALSKGCRLRIEPAAIRPISTSEYPMPAKRPLNSRLDATRIKETFGVCLPDWREGVDHILDQII